MSDNSTEGEQHKQVMEYLKKIVKDKLEKKNMERIKHLDLLYSKAVDDINVINTDKISDEDINRIKDEFNGSGKSWMNVVYVCVLLHVTYHRR